MRHDDTDPFPPYAGSFAVIRPDGPLYVVSIEPLHSTGAGEPLAYGSKHEAWGAMLAWARQFGLPIRDLTDGRAGERSTNIEK